MSYFKSFDEENSKNKEKILEKFSYKVKVAQFKKGDIVFHYGDPSDKFYLMLKGTIQVFIPKKTDLLNQELHKAEEFIDKEIPDFMTSPVRP